MPRIRPTTKIDVIGNLGKCPENSVGDFIESQHQNDFFVKPPNWDTAGDSIELLYIHNGRENQAMLRLQEEMLSHKKRQSAINEMHVKRVTKNQNVLRKRFINVNNFVRDCAEKLKEANNKVSSEVAKHESIRQNMVKYTSNIQELKNFRMELKKTAHEFEPYEYVIEEVVKKSDIFDSVKDCIDRVDASMLAQVEINSQEAEKLHEIEEVRKQMVKVTNEAALAVLGLKNDLSELERSYSVQRLECLKWEKILVHAKDQLVENDLNKERALDGIRHIYRLLCKRRGIEPKHPRHAVDKEADFIKDEIELLRDVVNECENRTYKATEEEDSPTDKQTIKC